MYNNAFISRDLFYEEHGKDAMHIEILDSHTYSYCYGMPVMWAAQNIQNGMGYEQVRQTLIDHLSRCQAYAPIFTLKYARPFRAYFGGQLPLWAKCWTLSR